MHGPKCRQVLQEPWGEVEVAAKVVAVRSLLVEVAVEGVIGPPPSCLIEGHRAELDLGARGRDELVDVLALLAAELPVREVEKLTLRGDLPQGRDG